MLGEFDVAADVYVKCIIDIHTDLFIERIMPYSETRFLMQARTSPLFVHHVLL